MSESNSVSMLTIFPEWTEVFRLASNWFVIEVVAAVKALLVAIDVDSRATCFSKLDALLSVSKSSSRLMRLVMEPIRVNRAKTMGKFAWNDSTTNSKTHQRDDSGPILLPICLRSWFVFLFLSMILWMEFFSSCLSNTHAAGCLRRFQVQSMFDNTRYL